MALKNMKINYYGFFGFLGFYGFAEPAFFLFFLFFLFFFATPKQSEGGSSFLQNQVEVKQENLEKVVKLVDGQDKVTNDDVQRLLGVSDATAERYLNELEKQGILKQSGEKKGAFYTKI